MVSISNVNVVTDCSQIQAFFFALQNICFYMYVGVALILPCPPPYKWNSGRHLVNLMGTLLTVFSVTCSLLFSADISHGQVEIR